MKETKYIAILLVLVGFLTGGLYFGYHSGSSNGILGGSNSPTLRNTTSSLVASNFTCDRSSSVALGPLSGITYLRITNDSTSTVYIGIQATSSAAVPSISSRTGIPLSPMGLVGGANGASSTFSGKNYWDSGESNVNIEGSYIVCIANATGSVVAYQQAK